VRRTAADRLVWHTRPYTAGDLVGVSLTFAATDDRSVNAQVAFDARQTGSLVLAVDDVPRCDFIAPALVRRGDLVIAISTNARSPAVARRVREWLDEHVPAYWSTLLEVAGDARRHLRARVAPDDWQRALAGLECRLAESPGELPSATQLEADLLRDLQSTHWSICTDADGGILDTLNKAAS
jgi:siroheme synthase-like protein